VAVTNDFGFGQKGAIVKITAISGFATCDVNGLTAVALRAHASMDQIPTGFWVFLLVHHGGENSRQRENGHSLQKDTAKTRRGEVAAVRRRSGFAELDVGDHRKSNSVSASAPR
jgi:hypothetical protein